jgi:hypothetical protein
MCLVRDGALTAASARAAQPGWSPLTNRLSSILRAWGIPPQKKQMS